MKMTIELLNQAEAETERFLNKIKEAKNRIYSEIKSDRNYLPSSMKEVAAVRRGALDLKQELTKITQSTNY